VRGEADGAHSASPPVAASTWTAVSSR
jgi:hypothetical protein